MPKQQAFITVPCRLINPAKSDLDLESKQIVEKINEKVRSYCKLNQWKNSYDVKDWFSNLKNKNDITFLVFDIVDFYSSISQELLINAIKEVKKHL